MKFPIVIYADEDGMFIAECPIIPGCVSQGKTEEEDGRISRKPSGECLEVRMEKGLPLTVESQEVEVAV